MARLCIPGSALRFRAGKSLIGALFAAGLLVPPSLLAATVSLAAIQDNTIYSNGNSNSTGQGLFVGRSGSHVVQRGLIAFDIGAIPSGATVDAVTLTLHLNSEGYREAPEVIALNRLIAGWGEGSTGAGGPSSGGGSGVSPETGDATWTESFHGIAAWASAGGDFLSATSASALVDGPGFYTWTDAGLIADVQAWIDGTANYGWILRGNESDSGSAKRFSSRENTGGGAIVPVLGVDYRLSAVPVPATAWLFGPGLAVVAVAGRHRRAR